MPFYTMHTAAVPDGLALDFATGRVYLTDSGLFTVGYFDPTSRRMTTLIAGSTTDQPRDIVLDTTNR